MKKCKWNISLSQRWKIPWLDLFIAEGSALRRDDDKIKTLEEMEERIEKLECESKDHLRSSLRAKQLEALIHQNLAMKGRLPAPLCPICNEPKIAGGIQWIDHAECYSGKSKGKNLTAENAENAEKR